MILLFLFVVSTNCKFLHVYSSDESVVNKPQIIHKNTEEDVERRESVLRSKRDIPPSTDHL